MVRDKGESVFSYSLSRPYPFAWFTWVATFGGIVCAVLFSFIALAADGYNLDLQYTLDLNSTLDQSYWFQKAPFSWVSKTSVSCQPALLTTGDTFFTSNLGFKYVVDKLWRENSYGTQNHVLPAAAYQNTLLEDCKVAQIRINLLREDRTMLLNDWWTWAATTASATVTCGFQTPSGGVKANLTAQIPSVIHGVQSLVLPTNISRHASMWFGAQLVLAWYRQVPVVMSYQQIPANPVYDYTTWDSGGVILSPNPDVTDYTDLNFFYSSAVFHSNTGGLAFIHPPNTIAVWANSSANSKLLLPNITTTVDTFAKSLYSLLLSDFGVADHTNALVTPAGVEWLQSQVDYELRGQWNRIKKFNYTGRPEDIQNAIHTTGQPYPINKAYQSVVKDLGTAPNLENLQATTLFTQYLCSIPIRKEGGALFFSVLIADLVALQAMWTLLNLGANWWLQRKDDQANYCDGCRTRSAPPFKRKVSSYQLLPVNPMRSSGVSSHDSETVERGDYSRGTSGPDRRVTI